ncbi:hypothetical protein [Natrinema gelatinilyticum]|uniref:hypothetical protein n=1 Tax=Natrinema gelatinilyticum TaxID=2961571 RepID=UPI0020C2B038|nr:hypothetical protein [Natrinema gelatinilyticum]
MTAQNDAAEYVLTHPILTGRICTPFGDFEGISGEIPVDDYDVASALIRDYSAEWPNGDPHPDREPESLDMVTDPQLAAFDPKYDEAQSATCKEIRDTYEMLVAEGLEDEAETIRFPELYSGEFPRGESKQQRIARRLAKKHLPEWW